MNFLKTFILSCILGTSFFSLAAEDLTVHEWGTFTSVSASNGKLLNGLYLEEEELPSFVHQFRSNLGYLKSRRARSIPLTGVNIKMETPVLYFYSPKEIDVDVQVKFQGGIIDKWYPDSINPKRKTELDLGVQILGKIKNGYDDYDFTKNYVDSIAWKIKVLAPNAHKSYTSPQSLETPTWINPRFTDANLIENRNSKKPEREKFIFYRGLANFQQALKIKALGKGKFELHNASEQKIPFAFMYEYDAIKKKKTVHWTDSLNGQETRNISQQDNIDTDEILYGQFTQALVDAGLYRKEAQAMIETWRHSYFEKAGLRIFWVLPREQTDAILPITIKPQPKQMERVLVGRTEILTPEFEENLLKKFTDETVRDNWYYSSWRPDRFHLAHQERALQLLEERGNVAKFAFLQKFGKYAPKLGDYHIITDKKTKKKQMKLLGTKKIRLIFSENNGLIEGEVEYFHYSPESQYRALLIGLARYDLKSTFTVKDGEITSEIKTLDLTKGL